MSKVTKLFISNSNSIIILTLCRFETFFVEWNIDGTDNNYSGRQKNWRANVIIWISFRREKTACILYFSQARVLTTWPEILRNTREYTDWQFARGRCGFRCFWRQNYSEDYPRTLGDSETAENFRTWPEYFIRLPYLTEDFRRLPKVSRRLPKMARGPPKIANAIGRSAHISDSLLRLPVTTSIILACLLLIPPRFASCSEQIDNPILILQPNFVELYGKINV